MANDKENHDDLGHSWNKEYGLKKLNGLANYHSRAFDNLTSPYNDFIYRSERQNANEVNGSFLELLTILFADDRGEEAFSEYVHTSEQLLTYVLKEIPNSEKYSEFRNIVNKIASNRPEPNMMVCMCHFSLINHVCECAKLHWRDSYYRSGWLLVRSADKHLNIKGADYRESALRLIDLATKDIVSIGRDELIKLLIKEFGSLCHSVTNAQQADSLIHGIPYAKAAYGNEEGLSYHLKSASFEVPGGRTIKGRFNLPLNLHGFAAYDLDGRPILAFRGTQANVANIITDIAQYMIGTSFVYKMALGLLVSMTSRLYGVNVYGHSLGGGLAQYAVAGLGDSNVYAFGYNSAGMSQINYDLLKYNVHDNIHHLHLPCDQIFFIGNQFGDYVDMNDRIWNLKNAHSIDTMFEVARYAHGIWLNNVTVD